METRANPDDIPLPPRSPADDPRDDGNAEPERPLGDLLLRTPLFHRILAGNAVVVALGAVVGTAVSVHVGRSWTGTSTMVLAAGFAGIGLVLSVVVNGMLVRWLLAPLERLERAAGRIQEGGDPLDEEVAVPPRTDPGLRRLVGVFNGMLRSLARQRARLREVTVRSLEAGEAERVRISGLLQEDTAQRVASCLIRLRLARDLDGARRDRALDRLRDELSDALESIRRLARSLRAPELDDIGLANALRALAREVGERRGAEVRLTLEDVGPALEAHDRLTLYRAVETTLRSWARETDVAGRFSLVLERRRGAVVAELRDDSAGRRRATVREHPAAGPGLLALRVRTRFSGGEIAVEPGDEETGASVRIRLPVDRDAGPGAEHVGPQGRERPASRPPAG